MRVKLHGVRGSRPTHKNSLLGYGGNSTSIQFLLPGKDFELYLDGGSGLAHHGLRLGSQTKNRKFYFLVTHTHWDHMIGYPFFAPLYNPNNEFVFYTSSPLEKDSFEKLFYGQLAKGHLPFPRDLVKAKIEIKLIKPGEKLVIDTDVHVSTYQLNHQGITLGFRVEYQGESAAVITDNAPIENGNHLGEHWKELAKDNSAQFEKDFNDGLVRFLHRCNTVIFDTHFTEENLKADWGHSTPHRATKFCSDAQVGRLILFHHAPEDTDQAVADKVTSVINIGKSAGLEVVAAREGDEWPAK